MPATAKQPDTTKQHAQSAQPTQTTPAAQPAQPAQSVPAPSATVSTALCNFSMFSRHPWSRFLRFDSPRLRLWRWKFARPRVEASLRFDRSAVGAMLGGASSNASQEEIQEEPVAAETPEEPAAAAREEENFVWIGWDDHG